MSIRVLIADDEEIVRTGLRLILETEDDIEVVGEAGDGLEAVEAVRRLRVDVALLDIRMPQLDGIETARRLVECASSTARVLILTTFGDDEYVYKALRAGASGFLLKHSPADQLVAGIRLVAAGESLLAPSITRRLIERFAHRPPPSAARRERLAELTDREVEVLELIGRGLSNAEIALRFVLSETTVKSHVSRIFSKLGLRDRAQAVVIAYESGLIEPGVPRTDKPK
jgi:DNA-binding NarL/FixJ family response regulator